MDNYMRIGALASWLSQFFADFPDWLKSSPPVAGWENPAASQALLQEYDDLFKGTNSNIYIPLWASACKGKEDILLDATTLEVVAFYYRWGYRPVEMDGNPPDFIGQQLQFLAYLNACALHGDGQAGQAAQNFIAQFGLDTALAVANGMRQFGKTALFHRIAELLLKITADNVDELELQDTAGWLDSPAISPVYRDGRSPAIPLGEPRVVSTAGRNNCGGKCVIKATVQEGCVLDIQTDSSGDNPQIRACVRGRGYRKTFLSGKRLRYPMQRTGRRGEGRFRRITWEEAADAIAGEWARIRDAWGVGSRYVNYATGVSAVLRPDGFAKRLLNLDGGYLDRYNSYSSACSRYISPYIYGDVYSGNSIEDVLHTKLLILWGHNPVETIFGSERNYAIARAREQGVRVIVVDPRYSDTAAAFADQWIGVRPSSDSALADAMAYVIWSEGLQNQHFMDTYCLGFDEEHMPEGIPAGQSYRAYLFGEMDGIPKTPAWAEEICGVPAQTIGELAREYATTKPACLLPGLGLQRTGNGEQAVRSLALLACMTGNVGIPGGGAAGAGAVKEHRNPGFPTLPNPFRGRIPAFLWTEAVENAVGMNRRDHGLEGVERLDSNIKMIVNLAGNTLVNQHSDINNTIRLLEDTSKCELILCSDIFMTSSTLFADILLPGTSFLEDDNMGAPWEFGNYLLCHNQVIPPLFGCRFEYDCIKEVADRLGLGEAFAEGHACYQDWLPTLYNNVRRAEPELPEYAVFKAAGGYRYKDNKHYIAYEAQIRDPENNRFSTPSGKIEIFSKRLYDLDNPEEIPAIPRYVACPEGPQDRLREQYPLQLIGWHTKRRCHSVHDNSPWMERVEPQRMWMHPKDAEARGISDGDRAEVFNSRGRVRIPVHVTGRIVQGVVAIPQGAWYTPDKDGVDVRGSINVLTSTRPTPIAKGNPQHTNLVQVEKAEK